MFAISGQTGQTDKQTGQTDKQTGIDRQTDRQGRQGIPIALYLDAICDLEQAPRPFEQLGAEIGLLGIVGSKGSIGMIEYLGTEIGAQAVADHRHTHLVDNLNRERISYGW
jgi:hypothetical protein